MAGDVTVSPLPGLVTVSGKEELGGGGGSGAGGAGNGLAGVQIGVGEGDGPGFGAGVGLGEALGCGDGEGVGPPAIKLPELLPQPAMSTAMRAVAVMAQTSGNLGPDR